MSYYKEEKDLSFLFPLVAVIVVLFLFGSLAMLGQGLSPEEQAKQKEKERKEQEVEKKREEEQAQIDKQVEQNIENTSKIDGQKIVSVGDKSVKLENGLELPISDKTSKTNCLVNDRIIGFNSDSKAFSCLNPDNISDEDEEKEAEVRYIYVNTPTSQPAQSSNNDNNLLTNLILWNYLTSNNYFNSNGYNRNYNWNNSTVGYSSPTQRTYETPVAKTTSAKASVSKGSTGSTSTTNGSGKSTKTSGFGKATSAKSSASGKSGGA